MYKTLKLQNSTNNLLNWFLDDRSLCLEEDGRHRPYEIAKQISLTYEHIHLFDNNTNKKDILYPKKYDASNYLLGKDKELLMKVDHIVNFIKSELIEDIENFLLHGSLATKDFSLGWSDVDSFMVIKSEVMKSPERLIDLRSKCLKIRNLFYEICPLQHHGIMAYSRYDVDNYMSSFLPLQALEESLELYSNKKLIFSKIDNEEIEASPGLGRIQYIFELTIKALETGEFPHHPYKGVPLMIEYRNHENAMQQLFWFIGTIMTMPAFLLTAINKPTLKKNSFILAKSIYSKDSWNLIEDASNVRNLWALEEGNKYVGNKIPHWLMSNFSKFYMSRFRDLLKESIEIISRNTIK
tara:strand:+ start:725 stop:1783 length:1059 start_codon:yes stop_codon:yes gene_type:complete